MIRPENDIAVETTKDFKEIYGDESFRDSLSTVDKDGKRIWLYPKKQKGWFFEKRTWVSFGLLAFLVIAPFIHIAGRPLFLLNVFERRFILFGQVFWPQDFYIFAIGVVTFIIFIILFTTVFGRVWCGWACPQTIFMEMVFRKIEYWIEGDAEKQRRLAESPWGPDKAKKRFLKWGIFMFISFLIAHTLLAWIIGTEQTINWMTNPPSQNPGGFAAMSIFTLLIFGIYIRFREQMCTTFCPYGRLQGVLLGDDSLTVAYDYKRGEKRMRLKKRMPEDAGDCIDCNLCVKVCPTGIDIRNGTQLECINCTLCIDACNSIMKKVDKPLDLIGYKSNNSIESGKPFELSTRQKAYIPVLGLISIFLVGLLFIRSDIETTFLRVAGSDYELQEDAGTISNLYEINIVNKTFDDLMVNVVPNVEGATVDVIGREEDILVPNSGSFDGLIMVYLPQDKLGGYKNKLVLDIINQEGKVIDNVKTNFAGPFVFQ